MNATQDDLLRELAEHRGALLKMAGEIVGFENAEDLLQEASMKMLHALPGFKGESKLSTWMHAITRNAALTKLKNSHGKKRDDRRNVSLSSDDDLVINGIAVDHQTPEQEVEAAQIADRISRRIERMNPKMQSAILAVFLSGMSYEQAAKIIGCPRGTIRSNLARAREMIEQAAACGPDQKKSRKGESAPLRRLMPGRKRTTTQAMIDAQRARRARERAERDERLDRIAAAA